MRTIPWLLLISLLAAPFALGQTGANDEAEDEERTDESGSSEHDEGADEARAEDEGEDETDDDGEENDHDERDDDEAREVRLEVDGLEATLKLERETRASEDKIEMRFDASEALLEVKYEAEANDTESEQKLRARFHEILEYVDTDGDGAYDPGEPIASAYRLGGESELVDEANGTATWSPITVGDVTSGNLTGKKLEGRATFGDGGAFSLIFYVFGDFATIEGGTLAPTEAKIDIHIQDYPYVRNDTRVGVVVSLRSEREFEQDHEFVDNDEEGLAANGATAEVSYSLVFTWKDSAVVDGVSTPVHSTILRNSTREDAEPGEAEIEQKALVVLSYARGDDILHDPTAGVSYQAMGAGTSMVPGLGPAMVAGALAAVAVLMRRRRQ